MTTYVLVSDDTKDGGPVVTVAQDDLEYLGDVAELLLQFLRATGYTYVKQLIVVKDGDDTVETML